MDRKYIKPYDQTDLKKDVQGTWGKDSPQAQVFEVMEGWLEANGWRMAAADLEVSNKLAYCAGCYDNMYNKKVVDGCWSFETSKLIPRKRVHINDVPPWNHTPELYPDCYKEPKYVFVGEKQTH